MLDLTEFGLRRGALVSVDTGPLIYLVEGKADGRAAVVRAFAAAAQAGAIRLTASVLAWTECLAGPLNAGNAESADRYRKTLSDSSVVVLEPVDAAIAEEAARLLTVAPQPGFADAFHLATAAVVGADAILANDGALAEVAAAASRPGATPRSAAYRAMKVLLIDELAFSL
jgi:predicted nucleic acid-binding protein